MASKKPTEPQLSEADQALQARVDAMMDPAQPDPEPAAGAKVAADGPLLDIFEDHAKAAPPPDTAPEAPLDTPPEAPSETPSKAPAEKLAASKAASPPRHPKPVKQHHQSNPATVGALIILLVIFCVLAALYLTHHAI